MKLAGVTASLNRVIASAFGPSLLLASCVPWKDSRDKPAFHSDPLGSRSYLIARGNYPEFDGDLVPRIRRRLIRAGTELPTMG